MNEDLILWEEFVLLLCEHFDTKAQFSATQK